MPLPMASASSAAMRVQKLSRAGRGAGVEETVEEVLAVMKTT